MHVIILYSGKYPGDSAGAKRVSLYKKGLGKSGTKCKVIPTHLNKAGRFQTMLFSLIDPLRIALIILTKIQKGNKLILYGYGWLTLFAITFFAKAKKCKTILEINEKPYSPYSNRILEMQLIKAFNIYMFERLVLSRIDGFIVISEALVQYLSTKRSKNPQVIKIPILVDTEKKHQSTSIYNLKTPFLFHAGSLSEKKDGITGVFQAFAIVSRRIKTPFHFYLTQKTAPAEVLSSINKTINDNNLQEYVHFIGSIPDETLTCYQQHCSMLILFKPDNEQNRYNFSTKLGEFMVYGKPVIYTPVGEMAFYLKNNNNAIEVREGSIEELAEKIQWVIENSQDAEKIGKNGQLMAQKEFNYQTHTLRLKQFLKELQKTNN